MTPLGTMANDFELKNGIEMTQQNSWWWPLPVLIVNTSTIVIMTIDTMTISFDDYYEHS